MKGPSVGRRVAVLVVLVLAFAVAQAADSPRADAQVAGFDLISLCDLPAHLEAGFRSFRVENSTGSPTPIELRNLNSGAVVTGTAAPGSSVWQIQGVNGTRNTTELYVNGELTVTKNSLNRSCAVLRANAACTPSAGTVTITWTITSFNNLPVEITSNSAGLGFLPNPMSAGGLGGTSATATETVAGAATAGVRAVDVIVDIGRGDPATISASVSVPPCEAALPPTIEFTFTKTAAVTAAAVGETITYTYAGTNLGAVPLEVVQLTDDRLGIVLDVAQATIVPPGGSLSRTVQYVVRPTDAGTTITNNAVVSVLDPDTGRVVQGVAAAQVIVPAPPDSEEPTTPTPTTTVASSAPPTTLTTAPATTVAPGFPAPPGPSSGADLPSTGAHLGVLVWISFAALTIGSVLVASQRRRSRPPPAPPS